MQKVANSRDFRRIRDLPTRDLDLQHYGTDLTPILGDSTSPMKLRPVQSAALVQIGERQGGFLPIGVGHGKTLIALLAPKMLAAKRPVLLVDGSLKAVMEKVEIPKYAKHFILPQWHAIVSYNDLSNPRKPNLIEELAPDVLVCDEAHALRHKQSVRVRRLARYLKANPETKCVFMSGTMTAKSLKDYSHLAKWALRDGSPVPYDFFSLEEWCAALDASPMIPMDPGVITGLCTRHYHETARDTYRCRMVSTPGVVATSETSLGTSLVLRARQPQLPGNVSEALRSLRETWSFDGQEMADALGFHRLAHQLSMGFYYKWVWDGKPDYEWLEAKASWARFVRKFLKHRSRPGLDSEGLVDQAVAAGTLKLNSEELDIWNNWYAVKSRSGPKTEAVWLSDFIIEDTAHVASFLDCIVWYRDTVVGERVASAHNLPLFGPGDGVRLASANSNDYPVIVASIKAHSRGQNLQSWNQNLILGMAGGARFEQLLARTHRSGQEADCVEAHIYQHTTELKSGFNRALESAEYIERTTGQIQKLNFAVKEGFDV